MTNALTRINPPTLPDTGTMGYSQITIAEPGRLVFISGQVAWQPGGEPTPSGLPEQTTIVLRNAKAALEAVGASPHDLVMVRAYVVGLTPERLQLVWPQVHAFFDGARPSLTGIGVAALAGPDLQLEVEMILRLPS